MAEQQQVQLFVSSDGQAQLQVALEKDTVWLSQSQMAELFDTSTDNIGLHLKNIYRDGELLEAPTTEDFSVVRQEGAMRTPLQAINQQRKKTSFDTTEVVDG